MIRIGIIGMSPGNAHPYSWSAIINGTFDGEEISRVGYPAVAAYLTANQDTLGLPAAKVTRVWTQDEQVSRSIASAAGIEKVSASLEDMAQEVDPVILARDDGVGRCTSRLAMGRSKRSGWNDLGENSREYAAEDCRACRARPGARGPVKPKHGT